MKILNKKAHFDYHIIDTIEAGLKLSGAEVKAVKLGHADLSSSFARLRGNEIYLVNARIYPYEYARQENYDEKQSRKLLLHRKQIISLKSRIDGSNLTITPVSLYTTRGLIKVELGIAKSKKKFEKKEAIKRADLDREMEAEVKYS